MHLHHCYLLLIEMTSGVEKGGRLTGGRRVSDNFIFVTAVFDTIIIKRLAIILEALLSCPALIHGKLVLSTDKKSLFTT